MLERDVRRAQRIVTQGGAVDAAGPEELAQQCPALVGQHAGADLRPVVQARLGKQIEHRSSRAALRVGRAVDDAVQPRVQDGAGAHGTGLQRGDQRAAIQSVVAQGLRRRAQGEHFGVGRRVVGADRGVVAGGDHTAILEHDRAHRHLAQGGGGLCLLQRQAHGLFIAQRAFGHRNCSRKNSCSRFSGARQKRF